MYFIHQLEETDCGFACLKILIARTNRDENYLYTPNPEPHHAYSFLELSHLGEDYGLTMEGYKVSDKKEALHIMPPFIAHLSVEGTKHFVIVSKVKKARVQVMDPKNGVYWMPAKDFIELFTGMLLAVAHAEKSKAAALKCNPVPARERFYLHVLQLLSIIYLLVALYFVNEDSQFLYPVIFFVAYFGLELLYKKFLLGVMARFDNKIIMPTMKHLSIEVKSNFAFLYDFKALSILSPLGFVSQLAVVLAIGVVMTFNAWGNAFIIIGCLGMALMETFLWNPCFRKQARGMAKIESGILQKLEKKQPVEVDLIDLNKRTYRYALLDETKKYVSYFILLAGCLLSMALSGVASVNYLVFHFIIFSYLLENVRGLFNYGQERLKIRDARNRYLSLSK